MSSTSWHQLCNCLPEGVRLLAVSKGHSVSSIRDLAELGQYDFGESRLQEAMPKIDELSDLKKLRWHFIGRLQSNKVRAVLRYFTVIHSVDSFALAERISRIAGEEKLIPEIMIQVKFREDSNKSGINPEQLLEGWSRWKKLPNLKLIGLMAMSPQQLPLAERGILFKECRELADQLLLPDCSMGMSSDWKEAVDAGATWLRIGSFLFGKRPAYFTKSSQI